MSMVNVSNLGFGGSGIPDALPKAVAELQGMKMTIVAGAAAGTVMPVPGMDPEDTIGSALNMTDLTTIDLATLSIGSRNAQAKITCLTTAQDGDSVTVNGKKYTIKDVVVHTSYNPPPGVVPIDITPSGCDAEDLAERLAKAIMSGDAKLTATVGPDTASPPAMTIVTVKVRQPGTAGNAYTLSEQGNAVTVSGATFTGGSAEAGSGFSSSVSLAGKKVLVVWYDKNPGKATAPLMAQASQESEDEDESSPPEPESQPSNLTIEKSATVTATATKPRSKA